LENVHLFYLRQPIHRPSPEADTDSLKMPSEIHEITRVTSSLVNYEICISLTKFDASRYRAISGESSIRKETERLRCRDRRGDWPTIQVHEAEAGLSQSLSSLRASAQWWLSNSRGPVKIVVLVTIRQEENSLRIERWCMNTSHRQKNRGKPVC